MMKKTIPWVLLTASVLLNLVLVLRTLDFSSGGGQNKISPNGKHVAIAQTLRNLNPLASERRTLGRFEIRKGTMADPPVISVTVLPENLRHEMAYREIGELIKWSPDSSNVVFRTPSGEFTVRVPETK